MACKKAAGPGLTKPFYSDAAMEEIAAAIDVPVATIMQYAERFERAALWHYSGRRKDDKGRPLPAPSRPFERRKKLDRIGGAARRLLAALTVYTPEDTLDGPSDADILEMLTYPDWSSEDHVLRVIRHVAELERLASQAADEVERLGEFTVPKDNRGGDLAVNAWTADMMSLYRDITGTKPESGIRIGWPGSTNEGIEHGPLIDFLTLAARPLGIGPESDQPENTAEEMKPLEYSPSAWRGRVRAVLSANRKTESDSV